MLPPITVPTTSTNSVIAIGSAKRFNVAPKIRRYQSPTERASPRKARDNTRHIQRTLSKGANRIIDVSWTVQQERSYPVKMQIVAYDRQGLLRDVASLVSDEHVNIADVSVVTGQKENIAVITATLDVRNAIQLARLMTKLDRLPNVREVKRKLG